MNAQWHQIYKEITCSAFAFSLCSFWLSVFTVGLMLVTNFGNYIFTEVATSVSLWMRVWVYSMCVGGNQCNMEAHEVGTAVLINPQRCPQKSWDCGFFCRGVLFWTGWSFMKTWGRRGQITSPPPPFSPSFPHCPKQNHCVRWPLEKTDTLTPTKQL